MKYYFKNESKLLFWLIASIFFSVFWTNYVSFTNLSLIFYIKLIHIIQFAAFIFNFIPLENNDTYEKNILQKYRELFISTGTYYLFILTVIAKYFFLFTERPITSLIYGLLEFFCISLINLIITGISRHKFEKNKSKIYIYDDSYIYKIMTFKSTYSENHPEKNMFAKEKFFKQIVICTICLVALTYGLFKEKMFYISFNQFIVSADSISGIDIFNSDLNLKRSIASENQNKKIIDLFTSELIGTSEQSSIAAENKNSKSSKDSDLTNEVMSQKIDDQSNFIFKFYLLKIFIALSLALFISYFWNSSTYKQDYNNKWEVLNQQLLQIVQSTTINKKLEIKFCIDCIELRLWAHKSFDLYFQKLIKKHCYDLFSKHEDKNIQSIRLFERDEIKKHLHKKLITLYTK